MSTQTKARLETLALVVALILSFVGGVKAWVLVPDRQDRLEKRITDAEAGAVSLSGQRTADRELLLRMSWNYEQVTKDIASINKKLDAKP